MRELKFKAFHIPTKTMYWFDLMWGNNGHGNGWIGMVPFGEPMTRNSHRDNLINIDPEDCEIMQFTGKTDMHESDLYEGDKIEILWTLSGTSCETVSFDNQYGYWKYGNNPICELEDPKTNFQIIGNIHDTEFKKEEIWNK